MLGLRRRRKKEQPVTPAFYDEFRGAVPYVYDLTRGASATRMGDVIVFDSDAANSYDELARLLYSRTVGNISVPGAVIFAATEDGAAARLGRKSLVVIGNITKRPVLAVPVEAVGINISGAVTEVWKALIVPEHRRLLRGAAELNLEFKEGPPPGVVATHPSGVGIVSPTVDDPVDGAMAFTPLAPVSISGLASAFAHPGISVEGIVVEGGRAWITMEDEAGVRLKVAGAVSGDVKDGVFVYASQPVILEGFEAVTELSEIAGAVGLGWLDDDRLLTPFGGMLARIHDRVDILDPPEPGRGPADTIVVVRDLDVVAVSDSAGKVQVFPAGPIFEHVLLPGTYRGFISDDSVYITGKDGKVTLEISI